MVPVFNVAQYLRRCVDSLLAQTFRDFEIILVDDGSTDGSGDICDEYDLHIGQLDDISIRVIHQANAGVSAARNRGIEAARGKYISFIDADDWVEPGFLANFRPSGQDPDIVVQGFWNHEGKEMTWPEARYNTAEELCAQLFEMERKRLIGYVWNKICRREVIERHHLRFDSTIPIGEDAVFSMAFLSHASSMVVTPHVGYHYVYPPGDHKDYPFEAWNRRLEAMDTVLSTFTVMPTSILNQFREREFKLGLYTTRVLYHEQHPRAERLAFLKKNKERGRRLIIHNSQFTMNIWTYEPAFRVLGLLTLYVPHTVADILLVGARKVRQCIIHNS